MDVCGWLTAEEALELASLAAGKVVLEIGTYCGKSALAMAKAARKVYCLDHFRGDSRVDGAGSRDEAFRNFDGHWDKIVVLAGSQEDVLPRLDLSGFDMVFYDADHSFESTVAGVDLLERLPSGATVVFHNYRSSHLVSCRRWTCMRPARNARCAMWTRWQSSTVNSQPDHAIRYCCAFRITGL